MRSKGRSISIHAAREGGDIERLFYKSNREISIHAAREGGDKDTKLIIAHSNISIHAAREGGDVAFSPAVNYRNKFQSTPPVKAATI